MFRRRDSGVAVYGTAAAAPSIGFERRKICLGGVLVRRRLFGRLRREGRPNLNKPKVDKKIKPGKGAPVVESTGWRRIRIYSLFPTVAPGSILY